MKIRGVTLFLIQSIVCLFLAAFALNASAHCGENGCGGYRHHYHHRYHHYQHMNYSVSGNNVWACGHYVPFDGYVPGQYVRMQ